MVEKKTKRTSIERVVVGSVWGRWTVIGEVYRENRRYLCECRCECGIEKTVKAYNLVYGRTIGCRDCFNKSRVGMIYNSRRHKIQVGSIFGKWTVVGDVFYNGKCSACRCKCLCGFEADIPCNRLLHGRSLSCQSCSRSSNVTHGKSDTPEYYVWKNMVRRCSDVGCNDTGYKNYGGRGISVCDEWIGLGGFERFIAHVGPRPSNKMSIERINNNGNYEPGNVRWSTIKEQARNTSRNRTITIGSKTKCISEWAELSPVDRNVIYKRIDRGWSVEDAVFHKSCGRGGRRR